MRTGLRNALILAVLVAAAAATWWWSRPAPATAAALDHRARALTFMVEATTVLTAADGSKDVEISAARLTEYPDEDRFVWEDLAIERARNGQRARITAARASGPTDGSTLMLENDVELVIERAEGGPRVFRAPLLSFDRARSTVQSSGTVEFLADGSRIVAERLEADLNESTLSLESVSGMKTSQLSTVIAVAAFSASAAAQVDGAEGFGSDFLECDADNNCVLRGSVWFAGEKWRIDATEARTARGMPGNGEHRIVDARFQIDGQTLEAPEAVFELVNSRLVKAALLGGNVKFEIDGAEIGAASVVFTFANEELATAEVKGNPVTFVDRSTKREHPATARAETLSYDYRTRIFQMLGEIVFARNGSEIHFCDLKYNFDTGVVTSGQVKCENQVHFRVVPAERREPPADNAP